MTRLTTTQARRTYAAADPLVTRALLGSAGLCDPPRRSWCSPALDDLAARLRRAVDDTGPFSSRWSGCLAGADDRTRTLAGEVLAVHLLVVSDVRATTKVALVSATWEGLEPEPQLDEVVAAALERGGLVPGGAATGFTRLSQLRVVVELARTLRAEPPSRRKELVGDPWALRDLLDALDVAGGHAQRAAFCHLLHPASFEPILSARVKQRVARGLGVDPGADLDRELLAARRRLTRDHGRSFSFLDEAVAASWNGPAR